jgi:hypothetical protein
LAKGSLGEYSVAVTGDTKNFEYAIQQSIETSNKFAVSIKKTSTEVQVAASGFKNGTFAIQQLALGVQDAASVFGTAGFSGAIRAAGNNVIQFASLLNPLAGTLAAVGITGVQVLADYFKKAGSEAKKAGEEILGFQNLAERTKLATAVREAGGRVADITTAKGAGERATELERMRADQAAGVAGIDKEIAAAQRRIGEIQNRVIEQAVRLDSQTKDVRPEFRKGLEEAARNKIARERDTFLTTEGREGGAYGAKGFRGMSKADLENIAKERALIEESVSAKRQAMGNNPALDEELKQVYQRRAELQMKESIEADLKAFGGAGNSAMDERKRKKAVDFENTRQKLIADNNRDMFAEEEAHRQRLARFNPFAGAAAYGSQQATEAISRAQAVPNDLVDIDKQVLSVQQKALSELSEIRLNTKPQKVEVVETFE